MWSHKVVVFDFDGVIHSYVTPWQAPDVIPDAPVQGIRDAISGIRLAGYKVVVISARASSIPGLHAIKNWLREHDIQVDAVGSEKIPAIAYVDDRAILFDGHPELLLEKVKEREEIVLKEREEIFRAGRDSNPHTRPAGY